MKNPKLPLFAPVIGVFGALIGLCLQLLLLRTGVDERGLLITTHPAAVLSVILIALVFAGLYLCLRPLTGNGFYEDLQPASPIAAVGCFAAAVAVGIHGAQNLLDRTDGLLTATGIVGAACAVCMLLAGILRLRGKRLSALLQGTLCLYLLLHLVNSYRHWNTHTQSLRFLFPLLALVFLALTAYYRACLDADSGDRRTFSFFQYGAVFLSGTAAATGDAVFFLLMALWAGTAYCNLTPIPQPEPMELPPQVKKCLKLLDENAYEAYVVGGCVRDAVLGRQPHDYDICTDALPEEIAKVFSKYQLVRNGEKHGTIGVVMDGTVYEITTYRTEGTYSDSRHPDWVEFVSDLKLDLSRRDFTVNAMAYSPQRGYLDPFNGQRDLQEKILRTVGDPETRFSEDALRILRGVRFAMRFDLTPHPETEKAMLSMAGTMEGLARERVFDELCKLLPHATAPELVRYAPVLCQVIPELAPCMGFRQHNPHHQYDVYTHTAHVVEAAPTDLPVRLAALLHDIGKPATFTQDENGVGHFYDHAAVGAKMADEILHRLKASNALREQVVTLVEQHMTPLTADAKLLRRRLARLGQETLLQLLALQKADGCENTDEIRQLIGQLVAENACLHIRDLAIDGKDLMSIGFEAGPKMGQVLEALLEQVIDEAIPNEKAALLTAAAAMKED